eukprot:10155867-Alexandrium_andersonii.AAC.1
MSASLVGSEMCIRDSPSLPLVEQEDAGEGLLQPSIDIHMDLTGRARCFPVFVGGAVPRKADGRASGDLREALLW